jgi:hypothetical protein
MFPDRYISLPMGTKNALPDFAMLSAYRKCSAEGSEVAGHNSEAKEL